MIDVNRREICAVTTSQNRRLSLEARVSASPVDMLISRKSFYYKAMHGSGGVQSGKENVCISFVSN